LTSFVLLRHGSIFSILFLVDNDDVLPFASLPSVSSSCCGDLRSGSSSFARRGRGSRSSCGGGRLTRRSGSTSRSCWFGCTGEKNEDKVSEERWRERRVGGRWEERKGGMEVPTHGRSTSSGRTSTSTASSGALAASSSMICDGSSLSICC